MAAPTPVSALLHAATMITAGIYLLFKFWCIFICNFHLSIGCINIIIKASISLLAIDIKKVIAYSTASQLGYLCYSVGLRNQFGLVNHLLVHAFFKSLLFLISGYVIDLDIHLFKLGGNINNIALSYVIILISIVSLIS
jgi:NADH-quinone oxidoreductase subunit L